MITDPQPDAFMRYFALVGIVVAALICAVLLKWGYHEWWVSTHCTMVLGTRVCQ